MSETHGLGRIERRFSSRQDLSFSGRSLKTLQHNVHPSLVLRVLQAM